MRKKKQGLTNSQINGIIWITIVLIVILAIIFFPGKDPVVPLSSDSIFAKEKAKLEKKEDSVYRSRWTRQHYQKQSSHRQQHTAYPDTLIHPAPQPPPPTRQPLSVELNSADTTTLMLLHGIGPAYARRIVRYRDRLGGFSSTQQLLEVYGFTPELLDHIAPHLRLDTSALRRIPINSIGLKQLIRHPYVEYYFARDLVNLRSKGVVFNDIDDLRAIPSSTDTMLAKLLPYLDF